MINKCNDCNHANICKYKDRYEKLLQEFVNKATEPFKLTLDCQHYYTTATFLHASNSNNSLYNNSLYNNYRDYSLEAVPVNNETVLG